MKQATERGRTVLWISRHEMTEPQLRDLERVMCGPVRLLRWTDTVKEITDLAPALDQVDAVAAVLPVEKLAQLLKLAGNKPVLQAVSDRAATGRMTTQPDGRVEREFAFVHRYWQQVLRIGIETRQL